MKITATVVDTAMLKWWRREFGVRARGIIQKGMQKHIRTPTYKDNPRA
ncbi:MAG: hypothetical protein LBQ81_04650 [Zoogloeaceae bacterium]|jgi:hypothetical protein|nr:hypothetical protein [Zoogloeaceae bacterium]